MRHAIDLERLGPDGAPMVQAIESCVHCGFCLPTCPTYVTLGEEMDSPRGRIVLMKETLEGTTELEAALPYLDNCLNCVSCVTACPSGVRYGELITAFRAHAEPERRRAPAEAVPRTLALHTLPHPRRLRAAAGLAGPARPLRRALPRRLRAMLDLLPARLAPAAPLPAVHPAQGTRRGRVALLAGCAQQVLEPDLDWATLRVLARNGIETVIPPAQGCCGALALHDGAADQARALARRNLDAFADLEVDAVITNAAGCGSGMAEYPLLFAGRPEHPRARELAQRTVDVTVYLARVGLREAPALAEPIAVAYHDACHLAHAQGVRAEPRALLGQIGGLTVLDPPEWELCCGSAGTYNVQRPELARRLGARKAQTLAATGAALVATGNIGCMTQLRGHLDRPVLHTIQVLDRAYARRKLAA